MNCRQFQNDLYEYLERSLPAAARAAAETHLEECFACRQRVREEQEVAQLLKAGFQRATTGLELPAEVGQRVMAAVATKRAAREEGQSGGWLWRWLAWPATAAASAAVLVAGWVLLAPSSGPGTGNPQPRLVRGPISVQLSFVEPVYTFRHEGGVVVDALTSQTTEVNKRIESQLASLR